jgi:hypothetical protein
MMYRRSGAKRRKKERKKERKTGDEKIPDVLKGIDIFIYHKHPVSHAGWGNVAARTHMVIGGLHAIFLREVLTCGYNFLLHSGAVGRLAIQ